MVRVLTTFKPTHHRLVALINRMHVSTIGKIKSQNKKNLPHIIEFLLLYYIRKKNRYKQNKVHAKTTKIVISSKTTKIIGNVML